VDKEKEYEAVCAFGTATDTQDATGEVTARGEDYPDPARILQEIPKLTGDIRQKPSMFSAIKVGGRHLYDLARRGESAEVPERTVHVERIEILGEEPEHAVRLRIACGRGTYIRSICDDLGKLCGCPAHMRSLIRTRSGFFTLDGALTLEEARELAEEGKLGQRLIPMDAPIQHLRRMDAPTGLARMVAAGAKLPLDRMSGEEPEENGVTRIYLENAFWGMAERRGDQLVWRAQIPPDSE
jgi:tRNA pseudouridine55 synthase